VDSQFVSYGLLADLAQRSERNALNLGKAKIQKLVFLLNELYKLETGYKFKFFSSGPFSAELAGDIDYLGKIDILKLGEVKGGDGYQISLGAKAKEVIDIVKSDLEPMEKDIEKMLSEFGDLSPTDLDLITTLVYVSKYDPGFHGQMDRLVEKTKELKPKVQSSTIEETIGRLSSKGHLRITAG